MDNKKPRVRFAPSPTGALHIGGVRTALYNYLFAKKLGGTFILRIEDTDSQRLVQGAEEYIINSLKWCGIEIDEGVSVGGPHSPYRQSERRDIYLKYANELIANGWAYYAFDSAEDLDKMRADYEARGETFSYNYTVRQQLITSLSLPKEEVEKRLKESNTWVIRFKMPENEEVFMTDIVRGDMKVNSATLDDKVLYKAIDALPTYHLANIVDDKLMEITHVIRGEEWLPSLPLHYLLYRAFNWSDAQPKFAHLPLLLKPSGKGKLSKRDGDKLGFPVFPLQWNSPDNEVYHGYREDGYLPDAFINMLALLGWNPGNDQEILSMDELIELFSLEKVGKSGSRFDPEKAKWFNAQYLKSKSDSFLACEYRKILDEKNIDASQEKVERVCALIKERAVFVSDFWELSSYLFEKPVAYDQSVVTKFWKGDNPLSLKKVRDLLAEMDGYEAKKAEDDIHNWIKDNNLPMGQVMNTLRLVLVGKSMGPSVFDIIDVIGKKDALDRIDNALRELPA